MSSLPETNTNITESEHTKLYCLEGHVFGTYRAETLIGRGGMCQVYKGRDNTGCEVAIKVYPLEHAHRVTREMRIGNRLKIPGIPRVFVTNKPGDEFAFIVMEFLGETTLESRLRNGNGILAYREALWVGKSLATTITNMHNERIGHFDIKPGNVMLAECVGSPSTPHVYIIDFGIARLIEPWLRNRASRETTGEQWREWGQFEQASNAGTVAYTAPEQREPGWKPSGYSDVYSLGIVLYEILTGQYPFSQRDPATLPLQHKLIKPRPIHLLNSRISPTISQLVERMLEKDPTNRAAMPEVASILQREYEREATRPDRPFPGWRPYSISESTHFVGREAETARVLSLIDKFKGTRWVHIEGPAGCGKTSMIQAGLPAAIAGWRPPHYCGRRQRALVLRTLPNESNMRASFEALLADLWPACTNAIGQVWSSADGLRTMLHQWQLQTRHTGLVLIVDPFETFLLSDRDTLSLLEHQITNAIDGPDAPLTLLTSLRSENSWLLSRMPRLSSFLSNENTVRLNSLMITNEFLLNLIQHAVPQAHIEEHMISSLMNVAHSSDKGSRVVLCTLHGIFCDTPPVNEYNRPKNIYNRKSLPNYSIAKHLSQFIGQFPADDLVRIRRLLTMLAQPRPDNATLLRELSWDEARYLLGDDDEATRLLNSLCHMPLEETQLTLLEHTPQARLNHENPHRVRLASEILISEWPLMQEWLADEATTLEYANWVSLILEHSNKEPQPEQPFEALKVALLGRVLSESQRIQVHYFLGEQRGKHWELLQRSIETDASIQHAELDRLTEQLAKTEENYRDAQRLISQQRDRASVVETLDKSPMAKAPKTADMESRQNQILTAFFAVGISVSLGLAIGVIYYTYKDISFRNRNADTLRNNLRYSTEDLMSAVSTDMNISQQLTMPPPPSPLDLSQPEPSNEILSAKKVTIYEFGGADMVRVSGHGQNGPVWFLIDRTEVTVSQFRRCVEAEPRCKPAITEKTIPALYLRNCNWNENGPKEPRNEHPMNCITASEAARFCEWAGKRLPNDWEWELAAYGDRVVDTNKYPWGNEPPTNQLCWSRPDPHTCAVTSHDADRSRFGVIGMAGNVSEFTATNHSEPGYRVVLGGSWASTESKKIINGARIGLRPFIDRQNTVGFRCVAFLDKEADLEKLPSRSEERPGS